MWSIWIFIRQKEHITRYLLVQASFIYLPQLLDSKDSYQHGLQCPVVEGSGGAPDRAAGSARSMWLKVEQVAALQYWLEAETENKKFKMAMRLRLDQKHHYKKPPSLITVKTHLPTNKRVGSSFTLMQFWALRLGTRALKSRDEVAMCGAP